MYLDQKIPEQCKQLWQECRLLIPHILNQAPIKSSALTINSGTIISQQLNQVYLIRDGIINEYHQDRLVMSYEDADLVGADAIWHPKDTEYRSDFAVIVDCYDRDQLAAHILEDKQRTASWLRYMTCMVQAYHILMAHFNRQEAAFHPELRDYAEGDVIIQEGATDSEVFTLLSGTAIAKIGDTVVGEVNTDEIFGAIAALTGTPRTASIIATSDCTALVVQSDRFRNLIAVRPDTVTKMVEDMARTIISCNEKIVDLSQPRRLNISDDD